MENKSLESAAAEDKSGQQTVTATDEPEAPEPNRLGNVHVVIAHPMPAGKVKDEPVKPGQTVTVSADRAKSLVAAGAAQYVTD